MSSLHEHLRQRNRWRLTPVSLVNCCRRVDSRLVWEEWVEWVEWVACLRWVECRTIPA